MFDKVYSLILNEGNPREDFPSEEINWDARQPYPPFLTVAGVFASLGNHKKVAILKILALRWQRLFLVIF